MKSIKTIFKIACWSLIIGGIGHFFGELFSPKNPEMLQLIKVMKEFTFQAVGTEADIYSFHVGFSFMMGLLVFSYGFLNLLILKNCKQGDLPSNILLLNSIITLIGTSLAYQYFFIVPTALLGLASLGFSYSFIKTKQHEN